MGHERAKSASPSWLSIALSSSCVEMPLILSPKAYDVTLFWIYQKKNPHLTVLLCHTPTLPPWPVSATEYHRFRLCPLKFEPRTPQRNVNGNISCSIEKFTTNIQFSWQYSNSNNNRNIVLDNLNDTFGGVDRNQTEVLVASRVPLRIHLGACNTRIDGEVWEINLGSRDGIKDVDIAFVIILN